MLMFEARPLNLHSALHRVSVLNLLGIPTTRGLSFTVIFNFNINLTEIENEKALLNFKLRPKEISPTTPADFCITSLIRWRLDISHYKCFADYLNQLKSNYMRNYRQSKKAFQKHGGEIRLIEGDWSYVAETVYQLYHNVSKKHSNQLYDLNYFKAIAKLKGYKLICIWHQGSMVASLVVVDEEPILHSMVCGLDYNHSTQIYAYSLLHYELLRFAIESKKHTMVDCGMTADKAKSMLNFKPIFCSMDIYAKNRFIKSILHLLSRLVTATIDENGKLKFKKKSISI